MSIAKIVKVIITIFTTETNAEVLRDYLWDCLTMGMAAVLFENPHILTAFYTAGNDAYDALALAISNWETSPTTNNKNIVKDKMKLVVIWLRGYASQVQTIANDTTNTTTREEARTNIGLSFLTAQELTPAKKGNPATPEFTASITNGVISINITNGPAYKPTNIIVVVTAVPPVTSPATPNPVVTLDKSNAQVSVTSKVAVQAVVKSISGKGTSLKIANMNTSPSYNIQAYAQNGNKQISNLSAPVLVTIVTLPETT